MLADEFPLEKALNKCLDMNGNYFYDNNYKENNNWKEVSIPHTFNDNDLFRDRIRDSGSGQKRTVGFYRNYLKVPDEFKGYKVFFECEGIRQTCYLYVNGIMAGYYEAGVAPFGFDITKYIDYDRENIIAIATDNTATRDIDFCIAETPNKPDVIPGSYLVPQVREVADEVKGVGFFWNCNDFNPSVGGLTHSVKIHFKPKTYLTLPIYSNMRTKGTYVYASDFDTKKQTARINVDAEVRNESDMVSDMYIDVSVCDVDGNELINFVSEHKPVNPSGTLETPLSITPSDAYKEEILPNGKKHYIPENDEDKVMPTVLDSFKTDNITALSDITKLDLWCVNNPKIYRVNITLYADGKAVDYTVTETGFRKVGYDNKRGVLINDEPVWLRGYAQRAANEWAAIGIAPQWLKDYDAELIRKSNANHIRFMHTAGSKADVSSYDRFGIICAQPAGDKEKENFGRQWDQRVELMRDVIIAFRNNPSVLFWEAGNNSINAKHMKEMHSLKEILDPYGGRFSGCRTLNTTDVIDESDYVGTMLNRHASKYTAEHGPIMETEYLREESPRRIWDDFTPPDFDYKNKWLGQGGRKQPGYDFYDLTAEEFALASARGYSEFFNDRTGGASGNNYYSGCAALCWTDSAQHGRQAYSENARMSGRVDPVRIKKQSFDVFRTMQSPVSAVKIIGHWNYPKPNENNYQYNEKKFNGTYWEETGILLRRDPIRKTVYAAASYDIKKVELYVNSELVGICEKPDNTFIFRFENINVTNSGCVEAWAYDFNDNICAKDKIVTADVPQKIKITPITCPDGFRADGNDIAFFDLEIMDKDNNICPLCSDKIDLELIGDAELLGGYNSGKFDFENKHESVIHKPYVFAECGVNRVFIRAGKTAGDIVLKAKMGDITAECTITSISVSTDTLTLSEQKGIYKFAPLPVDRPFAAIHQADKLKYTPRPSDITKILINGQEPDTRGVPSRNKNGCIWGAVLCILDRLKDVKSVNFDYTYDKNTRTLTIISGNNTVTAQAGHTHMIVNGTENLMDGEPYVTDNGIFVMEVSAVVSYINGIKAYFDDMINVFRIESI